MVLGQGERLLVHDGDFEVLDLLEWAKWDSWEVGLVQWKQVRVSARWLQRSGGRSACAGDRPSSA